MNNEIKTKYYDVIYFASSTINDKKEFFLRPVEEKLLIKLIQYSKADENITWSSKNIHLHTCIPIGSIDKAIQRLRQKNYITVDNKQISSTVVSRTININWNLISSIYDMYNEWVKNETNNVNASISDTQTEETYPTINKEEIVEISKDVEMISSIDELINKQTKKLSKYLVD